MRAKRVQRTIPLDHEPQPEKHRDRNPDGRDELCGGGATVRGLLLGVRRQLREQYGRRQSDQKAVIGPWQEQAGQPLRPE